MAALVRQLARRAAVVSRMGGIGAMTPKQGYGRLAAVPCGPGQARPSRFILYVVHASVHLEP